MKLSNSTIERIAVTKLNDVLNNSEFLEADIHFNDKTVSWDGEIFLYKNAGKKSSDFYGKVSVQVKGTQVLPENLTETIKYPVKIIDIKNYQKEGGVIFFVVYIVSNKQYRIYYQKLLPYELAMIIRQAKKQKTKNIPFIPFPKNKEKMNKIFFNFCDDRKRQYSTTPDTIDLSDIDINSNIRIFSRINNVFEIFDDSIYIYKQITGEVCQVITKAFPESITFHDINAKVIIDGKIYAKNVSFEVDKEKHEKFIIYNCVTLKKIEDTKVKIDLPFAGTLSEYICGLEFLKALKKGKKIQIGNFIEGQNIDLDDDIDIIDSNIRFWKNVKVLLQTLHVNKELNMEQISENSINTLALLYQYIVEKRSCTSYEDKDRNANMQIVEIGNIKLLLVNIIKNKQVNYIDFFQWEHFKCSLNDQIGTSYPTSIYVKLPKEYLLDIDNIDFKAIKVSVTSIPYSRLHGEAVNQFILELLRVFDESKREEFWNLAESLSKWLMEQEENIIYRLNYYQIIKRKRVFTHNEFKEIQNLKRKHQDTDVLLGISILLGNQGDIQYYYEELSDKVKKEFLNYPIMNLIEDKSFINNR